MWTKNLHKEVCRITLCSIIMKIRLIMFHLTHAFMCSIVEKNQTHMFSLHWMTTHQTMSIIICNGNIKCMLGSMMCILNYAHSSKGKCWIQQANIMGKMPCDYAHNGDQSVDWGRATVFRIFSWTINCLVVLCGSEVQWGMLIKILGS